MIILVPMANQWTLDRNFLADLSVGGNRAPWGSLLMGVSNTSQWQIQDFPKGRGAPTFYLTTMSLKTAWKWKKLDWSGVCFPVTHPGSATSSSLEYRSAWGRRGSKSMTSMYGCVKICGVCFWVTLQWLRASRKGSFTLSKSDVAFRQLSGAKKFITFA